MRPQALMEGASRKQLHCLPESLFEVSIILYPVVALNSALRFIKPLAIKERLLNQCHLLD
jgi:hypothetical protein